MTELGNKPDLDVDPPVEKPADDVIDSDSEIEEGEDESDEEPQKLPSKEMYQVKNSVEFLDRSWVTFSLFFGLYYVLQFGLALCAANMYAHSEADSACVDIGGTTFDGEGLPESRSVYDTALLLLGLYHIIEWFRTILLLTVTCMKYEILMYIYNALFLNAIFGVIVALYAHVARFGAYGSECAGSQTWTQGSEIMVNEVDADGENVVDADGNDVMVGTGEFESVYNFTGHPKRAQYLLAEIIFFYILYIISGIFIAAFPKMAYELAHSSWTKREQ